MNVVRYGHDPMVFHRKTALTVGTFDGVHCGHRGIVERMIATAREHDERTVVVTFDPHPQIVLARPDREPVQLLTTIDERCELFAHLGIDMVVVVPFNREFAAIPADTFVRTVIVQEIGVQHFFIGHDHSFGKNRGGNEELLQQLGHELDFDVVPIPPLECAGVVVSSTKVRNALKTGGVDEAHRFLGRPYAVRGVVGHGDKRGRTLGIPTANIQVPEHKLLPANGIYVVSSVIDGSVVVGMASVGVRPMFTNDVVPTLEVNYLDIDTDLYGRTLEVVFHARLRDEIKYESVDELLAQIEIDRNDTRLYQQQFLQRRTS